MKKGSRKNSNIKQILRIVITLAIIIAGTYWIETEVIDDTVSPSSLNSIESYQLDSIPEYSDSPYVIINDNIPSFEEKYFTKKSFEKYSNLDKLGRCGVAFANLSKKTMPKDNEKRTSISKIYPSGWNNKEYDTSLVNGGHLYNRCHLIAYALSAENANEKNLITGTRYFNTEGMLPFETKINNYLRENNDKHVLYRVTPIFKENNLVASGVVMEAKSVEDRGESVCFSVYVYNVQPGIEINYTTGDSKLVQ